MKKFYEIIIISAIFFIICIVFSGQQRITLNEGKGWDGIYYYNIAEQIGAGRNPIVGELPFIRRLGSPYLISKFSAITGKGILDSALYINLAGALITVICFLVWLRKYIDDFRIRGLLCLLFMMAWYAPLRFSFYIPLTSDSWGAVWFMGSLLILQAIKEAFFSKRDALFIVYVLAYSVIIGMGNLFRESNAALCILPFFILNPFKPVPVTSRSLTLFYAKRYFRNILERFLNWRSILLLLPVFSVVLSMLFIKRHILNSDQNVYSYTENILTCFYTKTLPEYLLGIFIAFGPLVLLIPLYSKLYKYLFSDHQELLVLLIISMVFGYIGGTDTERILFMSGFPVFLLMMGISVGGIYHSNQRWWLFILIILQTIAFRFYWALPDYTIKSGHTPIPFFGLMSSNVKYLYLYSHFSNYEVNTILLAEYLLLYLITWYVVRNQLNLNAGLPFTGKQKAENSSS